MTSARPEGSRIVEPASDPTIPIIDSHHHLFESATESTVSITNRRRFTAGDYLDRLGGGHRVIASVAVDAHNAYRQTGPEETRVVGETEFLAAQGEATDRARAPTSIAAAIVGSADLRMGRNVKAVLEEHLEAAPRRFKGIRQVAVWQPGREPLVEGTGPHLYLDDAFRQGFAVLGELGLSFDAFVLADQLADVIDLARGFPGTPIVLNHVGGPNDVARSGREQDSRFESWRSAMAELAGSPQVMVKLGGLASVLSGSGFFRPADPPPSIDLAREWRPYVQETIELFGAGRVMVESDLPTDDAGPMSNVWNAFQHITENCSDSEREAIFSGSAISFYRLTELAQQVERTTG